MPWKQKQWARAGIFGHSFGNGSDRDGKIMKKEPIGGDKNAQGSGTVPRGE